MTRTIVFAFFILLSASQSKTLDNSTCAACHPKIVHEYEHSIHANSSIYNDPVHKAVWDKHPLKAKGKYKKCAKCHTPSDRELAEGKNQPNDNPIQRKEPISCQTCHHIESIEKHKQSNTNHYTSKKKYFYSADKSKKGTKLIFHKESSFFGLITKTSGSPYHDIDYSNEAYYDGEVCMGCHSHKKSENGFDICDLGVEQGDSQQTCISCHMPQVKGSFVNLKSTTTHAFHGISIHNGTPQHLAQYIDLNLTVRSTGFDVQIHNHATHALFVHSLRLGQLRITIRSGEKNTKLKPVDFRRVIGKNGKPSPPWSADTVLSDTTIKAHETRIVHFDQQIHKGDTVTLELGYYIVDPETARELNITSGDDIRFTTLVKKMIKI